MQSNFSESQRRTLDNNDDDNDSVDQLLDDALEESYRSVLEDDDNNADAEDKNKDGVKNTSQLYLNYKYFFNF